MKDIDSVELRTVYTKGPAGGEPAKAGSRLPEGEEQDRQAPGGKLA